MITVTVKLGEIDVSTKQTDREKAIEEARNFIGEEYGFDLSRTCIYTIEGEGK